MKVLIITSFFLIGACFFLAIIIFIKCKISTKSNFTNSNSDPIFKENKKEYLKQQILDLIKKSKNSFINIGRGDGIGNRIWELIKIQEYCIVNNKTCLYLWTYSHDAHRNYLPLIKFANIKIIPTDSGQKELEKFITTKNNPELITEIFSSSSSFATYGTRGYMVKYNFLFDITYKENYDIIIHIRASDRLTGNSPHMSTKNELKQFIKKTIDYINKNQYIQSYTIVSDDKNYINYTKNKIKKKFIDLSYNSSISNDWLDFYYLTKGNHPILMCSKFSSFAITAARLGHKKLLILRKSSDVTVEYKVNIEFID